MTAHPQSFPDESASFLLASDISSNTASYVPGPISCHALPELLAHTYSPLTTD